METMKKRITSLLLALALCLGLTIPAGATGIQHFKDVPTTHWAYQQIERAYADGVMNGTGGNAANGTGVFSPAGTLTMAQFATIMTRAFYSSEVQAETDKGNASPWYAPAETVGNKHGLFDGVKGGMTANVSRYDMAMVMSNILEDLNAKLPADAEKQATQGRIGDFGSIPSGYKGAVTTVFFFGVITGTDSKGTFSGNQFMNRAQAAVVYGRLKDVIDNMDVEEPETPVEPSKPVEPETPVTPTEPEKPTTPSDVVGTISSTPVTLRLDTHKPVVDYWSEQSATVKAAADKDAFNAAMDTLIHSDMIVNEGEVVGNINKYYNYAVFGNDSAQETINVSKAMRILYAYGAQFPGKYASDYGYFTVRPISDDLNAIFAPIFANFTDDMSDMEKVEICVKEVCRRFDYGAASPGFSWTNGKTTGDCDNFSRAIQQILGAAGIPCYQVKGTVRDGAHAWNHAYVDGEWVIIDGGAADVGYGTTMTMAAHEKLYGYSHSLNTSDGNQILHALVETAEKYR